MSKIDAIRAVRARLHLSLKESKELVDDIATMLADYVPLVLSEDGVPLRDRFAMAALVALLSAGPTAEGRIENCREAYRYADSMLEARAPK